MKKLIFFFLFIISLNAFSQQRNVSTFQVTNSTTAFGKVVAKNTIVFDSDAAMFYKLTAVASAVDNLNTASKIMVNGGDAENSDSLGGEAPSYYLDRVNHTGSQTITTVTGLQDTIDRHTDTLQALNVRINNNVDSLSDQRIILNEFINDSSEYVWFVDTLSKIGTKYNEDTLSLSIYDSMARHTDTLQAQNDRINNNTDSLSDHLDTLQAHDVRIKLNTVKGINGNVQFKLNDSLYATDSLNWNRTGGIFRVTGMAKYNSYTDMGSSDDEFSSKKYVDDSVGVLRGLINTLISDVVFLFIKPHGGLKVNGTRTHIVAGTPLKIDFSGLGLSEGGMIQSASTDRVTVPRTGRYKITYSCDMFSPVSNITASLVVYRDGASIGDGVDSKKFDTGIAHRSYSKEFLLDIDASSYVELFLDYSGSASFVSDHIILNVQWFSNTP